MNNSLLLQSFLDRLPAAFRADDADADGKAWEAANVRLLTEMYAALGRGDVQGLADRLADDVVFEIFGPPAAPIVGRWEGRPYVLAALARNFSLFADQQPTVEYVVAQGDIVVLFAQETGRYLPTNRSYDVRFVQFFLIRDGKIKCVREHLDGGGPWA